MGDYHNKFDSRFKRFSISSPLKARHIFVSLPQTYPPQQPIYHTFFKKKPEDVTERWNFLRSYVSKNSQSFRGLIQVFLSVCQLCDGGITLRSAVLSFSHLNANEHASCQRAAETVWIFNISYHQKVTALPVRWREGVHVASLNPTQTMCPWESAEGHSVCHRPSVSVSVLTACRSRSVEPLCACTHICLPHKDVCGHSVCGFITSSVMNSC